MGLYANVIRKFTHMPLFLRAIDMEEYVLVVDDEPDAQEILTRIVRSLSLTEQTASDGKQALKKIAEQIPCLVLLDLMMPHMDGFEVLRRLQSHSTSRGIPIIMITACQPSQLDMLRLPGVAQVVQKGRYTISELKELVLQPHLCRVE